MSEELQKQIDSLKKVLDNKQKEIDLLRKENLELQVKSELNTEDGKQKTAIVEELKKLPILEQGQLQDGSFRGYVKIKLPKSGRIATMAEPDTDIMTMPEYEESEKINKILKCLIIVKENDKETQVTDEIRETFHKVSEKEINPIIEAYVWLRKELMYPDFFREKKD